MDPNITVSESDYELLSMPELSDELRKRHIIDRSPQTLTRWAKSGLRCESSTVILSSKWIGKRRHSTVAWFVAFLDQFEPEKSVQK